MTNMSEFTVQTPDNNGSVVNGGAGVCNTTTRSTHTTPSSSSSPEHHPASCYQHDIVLKCAGCQQAIVDKFILKVLERAWHSGCLRCADCRVHLTDRCFSRDDMVYCKDDFFRRFGTKCASCEQGIPPSEIVRRAQDNVYHLDCFSCLLCKRQLETGDEFYLMDDHKLVCKLDYEDAKAKEDLSDTENSGNKRPRTTISAKQLEVLKVSYNKTSKPARHVREKLAEETGLDMRVVQVWFQNRRAKEKRLKKDAGRQRWGQFMKTCDGKHSKSNKNGNQGYSDVGPVDSMGSNKMQIRDDLLVNTMDGQLPGGPPPHGSLLTPAHVFMEHVPPLGWSRQGGSPFMPGSMAQHLPPNINSNESLTAMSHMGGSLAPSNGHNLGNVLTPPSGPGSDVSSGSSQYPDFPSSPVSWMDEMQANKMEGHDMVI